MDFHERVHFNKQDFHYQNQTDRPKSISARQWAHRRNVWDSMYSSGQWYDVLALDICQWDMWIQLDPQWDVARAESKARKAAQETK